MNDFSYVPAHLLVKRGYAGWPEIIAENDDAQEWLIAHCRDAIRSRPLTTGELYQVVRNKPGFPSLGCGLNIIHACIDRAARAAEARQVWFLEDCDSNETTGDKKPRVGR